MVMFGDSSAKPPDKAAASGHAPSANHMVIKADMIHITSNNTWYSALSNPEPAQQVKGYTFKVLSISWQERYSGVAKRKGRPCHFVSAELLTITNNPWYVCLL